MAVCGGGCYSLLFVVCRLGPRRRARAKSVSWPWTSAAAPSGRADHPDAIWVAAHYYPSYKHRALSYSLYYEHLPRLQQQ